MRRCTFISQHNYELSSVDLADIEVTFKYHFEKSGVTGVLLSIGTTFFYILEGEEQQIDTFLKRIEDDDRHGELLILKDELDSGPASYMRWNMYTVDLDDDEAKVMEVFKQMIDSLTAKNQHLERAYRTLQHYTPSRVLNKIEQQTEPWTESWSRSGKVVLFTDLVNFSHVARQHDTETSMTVLNTFMDVAIGAVSRNGGEVEKIMGDGLMAHFEAYQSEKAITASLSILEELRHRRISEADVFPLYAGIGLAGGTVMEGNIGNAQKMDYTIIGDTVNTAAKIEAATRSMGFSLLLDEFVSERLQDRKLRQVWNPSRDKPLRSASEPDFSLPENLYTVEHPLVYEFPDRSSENPLNGKEFQTSMKFEQ